MSLHEPRHAVRSARIDRRPEGSRPASARATGEAGDAAGRVRVDDLATALDVPNEQLDALADAAGRVHAALANEPARATVQARSGAALDGRTARTTAARGVAGGGTALPFAERIQRSFGRHAVAPIRAHVGQDAARASAELGAIAFATGEDVAFGRAPDLFTTAHEAAHVVQQRGGVALTNGVGRAGDVYEQHADAVAHAVVHGRSAEGLLDTMARPGGPVGAQAAGVQRKEGGDAVSPVGPVAAEETTTSTGGATSAREQPPIVRLKRLQRALERDPAPLPQADLDWVLDLPDESLSDNERGLQADILELNEGRDGATGDKVGTEARKPDAVSNEIDVVVGAMRATQARQSYERARDYFADVKTKATNTASTIDELAVEIGRMREAQEKSLWSIKNLDDARQEAAKSEWEKAGSFEKLVIVATGVLKATSTVLTYTTAAHTLYTNYAKVGVAVTSAVEEGPAKAPPTIGERAQQANEGVERATKTIEAGEGAAKVVTSLATVVIPELGKPEEDEVTKAMAEAITDLKAQVDAIQDSLIKIALRAIHTDFVDMSGDLGHASTAVRHANEVMSRAKVARSELSGVASASGDVAKSAEEVKAQVTVIQGHASLPGVQGSLDSIDARKPEFKFIRRFNLNSEQAKEIKRVLIHPERIRITFVDPFHAVEIEARAGMNHSYELYSTFTRTQTREAPLLSVAAGGALSKMLADKHAKGTTSEPGVDVYVIDQATAVAIGQDSGLNPEVVAQPVPNSIDLRRGLAGTQVEVPAARVEEWKERGPDAWLTAIPEQYEGFANDFVATRKLWDETAGKELDNPAGPRHELVVDRPAAPQAIEVNETRYSKFYDLPSPPNTLAAWPEVFRSSMRLPLPPKAQPAPREPNVQAPPSEAVLARAKRELECDAAGTRITGLEELQSGASHRLVSGVPDETSVLMQTDPLLSELGEDGLTHGQRQYVALPKIDGWYAVPVGVRTHDFLVQLLMRSGHAPRCE